MSKPTLLQKIFFAPLMAGFISLVSYLTLAGCGPSSDGFFFPALGINEGRILVINNTTTLAYTVTMHSLSGEFLGVVADTTATAAVPRGLAFFDSLNVIVAIDTPDQLGVLNIFSGEMTTYAEASGLFTGNIYDVRGDGNGSFYVAESNTVERFTDGTRVPVSGATPYVATTLTACTIATARGVTMAPTTGRLIVVSNGNDRALAYDVTGASSATCSNSFSFAGTTNPIDAVGAADGNIYVTGNGDDTIYQSADTAALSFTSIFLNTGVIDNPTAIASLPNGNLIIASDVHDSIVEITTAGTVVNASFIKNAFTNTVLDILVIPPR